VHLPRQQERFLAAVGEHARGSAQEAERGYRALLDADPRDERALRFLGLLLAQREELADAVRGLPRGAAAAERRAGDAPFQCATALAALGRAREATAACRQALAADPAHGPALVLLATLLREQGQVDEALSACRRAVRAAPGPAAYRELGLALKAQERLVEAIAACERAVELAPQDAQLQMDLGNALLAVGELRPALERFERAERLEPGSPGAANNIAITAQRMGRFREAARAARRAIALDPANMTFRYNLAFSLLGQGDLAEGWELFDDGFAAGGRKPDRAFAAPRWDGSALPGGTLLVWREQGVGDELRLASCYPDAARRAGHVLVECDPRLVPLFTRSFPGMTVRAQLTGPSTPDFDVHCPAGSLPRHLRPTVASFPRHGGYLTPDPTRLQRWRERLAALGPGLRVGISWRSMNLATGRLSHYTTLREWEPVLATPGVHFVNLQYGPEQQLDAELEALRQDTGRVVHRWDDVDYTDDFDDVAALMASLDLVIGVGTTPALLAGALGLPVWMLALPDPLTLGTRGYPWLPSLRRYPREWNASWEDPMRRIAAALRQRAGQPAAP
jgi:tetratricopeptide (TPR) repeat protein